MKILIIGSDGFIGRAVLKALSADHDVYGTSRTDNSDDKTLYLDLTEKVGIIEVLKSVVPQAVINCAGVVDNSEKAELNPLFTSNLLASIVSTDLKLENIIISGSAAEYGMVSPEDIPVDEETPLMANAGYGLSKLKEEKIALEYREKHHLPVTVTRIFNPIGAGMHPRFLISSLIRQINDIQAGSKNSIEISRLDTKRDYINVQDVALAFKELVENTPNEQAYNIGSGKSISNGELIELIFKNSKMINRPRIIETFDKPEPLVAIQADITRIYSEFGWSPTLSIEDTVKEVINDKR